jgi:hypothetical protein
LTLFLQTFCEFIQGIFRENMSKLPKAKTVDMVVQESGKELLLYNLTNNKAYCLNKTSAIIYQACDGETTFAELKEQKNFSDELIFFALDELKQENLLDENYVSPFNGLSRRQIVKKIGLSYFFVLPVIASVVAPAAAAAQSTCINPGGRLDGQVAGNFSTSGPCGSQPSSFYEGNCDSFFANRCCNNEVHFANCTTLPGNPPGNPPFSSVICNCGP